MKIFSQFFKARTVEPDLALIYTWMNKVRIFAGLGLGLIIGILWFIGHISFDPYIIFVFVLPLFFVSIIFWHAIIAYHFHLRFFLHTQFIIDFSILAFALSYTGAIDGPFVFLFVMPVISASLFSLKEVLLVSFEAIAFYLISLYFHVLISGRGADFIFFALDSSEIERFLVFLLFVALVAVQSGFYVSRIKKKDQELIKIKDEFLYRAIHDLRAPANVIRLILEKYESPKWFASHPETTEDVKYVKDAAQKILDLIKDALSVARGLASETSFKKERLYIVDELKKAIDLLAPVILEKRIRMKEDRPAGDLVVLADREKLSEVFINIIDNAIKYNKEGGEVIISYKSNEKFVKIFIADTGRGIASDDIPLLFTPYFRGSVAKDDKIGTGLGLFIVRQLLIKMGGEIELHSKINIGTTVIISLPCALE